MSSAVHFRFKSARDFDTVTFDGDFISIADLKVGIVEVKKLNYGEGFDLDISDAQTNDDYADEAHLLPKNTSVVVRRVPGLKPGGILSQQAMASRPPAGASRLRWPLLARVVCDARTRGGNTTAGVTTTGTALHPVLATPSRFPCTLSVSPFASVCPCVVVTGRHGAGVGVSGAAPRAADA